MVSENGWRALYPFESHFFVTGGHRLHYLDEGAGDPLVMLHGNPTWSFYFRNLVHALSPDYRCVVPDHVGCGLSDKPANGSYDFRLESRVRDLERLLDSLGLERITLLVHDWGGMIGMAYAHRNPERVSRLVVTNTAAFGPPGGKGIPIRLRLIRDLAPFGTPAVLGFNAFARGALWMAPHRRLAPAVRAGLVAPYDSPRNRRATLRFVQDIPLEPGDPSFDLVDAVDRNLHQFRDRPMLILWGRHDFVFDLDYFAEWKRRFPRARHRRFDDAGHYLIEDKPVEIAAYVKDFLKKTVA
jgi:haloalkane dehalogenase